MNVILLSNVPRPRTKELVFCLKVVSDYEQKLKSKEAQILLERNARNKMQDLKNEVDERDKERKERDSRLANFISDKTIEIEQRKQQMPSSRESEVDILASLQQEKKYLKEELATERAYWEKEEKKKEDKINSMKDEISYQFIA